MLEYAELGMEAVWRIEVEDFPAFIVVDDKGNDFFADPPRVGDVHQHPGARGRLTTRAPAPTGPVPTTPCCHHATSPRLHASAHADLAANVLPRPFRLILAEELHLLDAAA